MRGLWLEVRYAIRGLARSPSFTIVSVLTLAIALGGTTAIFSVVNAVLLRPLPYHKPDRLIWLSADLPAAGVSQASLSGPEILDLRTTARMFEDFAFIESKTFTLLDAGHPQQVRAGRISANWFSLLGIRGFTAGRNFSADEAVPGGSKVVILSHRIWQRSFGSDRHVIGRRISLDGQMQTVVGVLPSEFALLLPDDAVPYDDYDVWVPCQDDLRLDRDARRLAVLGRMKPSATLQQAKSELHSIAHTLRDRYYTQTGFRLRASALAEEIRRPVRPAMLALLGSAILVLMIACANLANLALVRTSVREKDIAIRQALGASRFAAIRAILVESSLLATLGGCGAILVAVWGIRVLAAVGSADIPRLDDTSLDLRVMGFLAAVSTTSGVLLGLVPAASVTRMKLYDALKSREQQSAGRPNVARTRRALVISQIALSAALLISAGLVVRSFLRLQAVEPGFDPAGVLTLKLNLRSSDRTEEAVPQFFETLRQRVGRLPGVTAVGLVGHLPLSGHNASGPCRFDHQGVVPGAAADTDLQVDRRVVAPGYFRTMRTRLLTGRAFTQGDNHQGRRVAIVDRRLAQRAWPDQNPLGRRITPVLSDGSGETYEVVGVVDHVRHHRLTSPGPPQVYFCHLQAWSRSLYLVTRSSVDPTSLVSAIRHEVANLDSKVPLYSVRTMNDYTTQALAELRYRLILLGTFATVALILATIGVYGVVSNSVVQRTHEFGIRMALGATPADILRMIVSSALRLSIIGVAIGDVSAFGVRRFCENQLFGVAPWDPFTYATASFVLVSIGAFAGLVPALRAASVPPRVALAAE